MENVLLSDSGNYQLCDFGSATLKEVKPLVWNDSVRVQRQWCKNRFLPQVEGVGKIQEDLDK